MKRGSLNNYFSKGYANRGMSLEGDINISNKYYLDKDIAIIYKKPTPIKATKIVYTKTSSVITEGFFEMPSTTDYNGIYKGRYIDFDAKETNSKTSFSLNNVHSHQLKHIDNVYNHGGISFLIIRFNLLNKTYLLPSNKIELFIKNEKRRSIPINFIENNGIMINGKYNPRLDYIEAIDKYILEESNYDAKKK
ncbi:MAG TPA: Holliday junction resolvase RecU [Bacilli bacterium]|nr:Holliday junction resolvase RecU [Bacilli bacterium]